MVHLGPGTSQVQPHTGKILLASAEAWLLSSRFWIVHPTGTHGAHSKLYHPSVPKRRSKQKASSGVLETSEGPKIQNSLSGPFDPMAILSQTPDSFSRPLTQSADFISCKSCLSWGIC